MLTNLLANVAAVTEDPIGLQRPLWRDYSRWQEQVNFEAAFENNVLGMASRSTISWGYQDSWFPRNWDGAGQYGLYRTSYHILYPGENVVKQADNWYRVHPEIEIVPRVIDLELHHNLSWSQIANATWELSEVVLQRDGIRPIIYSRKNLIDTWLSSWTTEMLNDHWYWLAQYLGGISRYSEHPGPPDRPNRVREDRIILHQTSDKKPGFAGEVASKSVDWDRWELGDEVAMHAWIYKNWMGQEPEPEPEPEPEKVTINVFITDYAYKWMVGEGYNGPKPTL